MLVNFEDGSSREMSPELNDFLNKFGNSPIITELIGKGMITPDMTLEQILSILSIQGIMLGGNVDIQTLINQIKANYQNYSGDITTASSDWMEQLMANNPELAGSELLGDYTDNLANIQETADLNLNTDLSWFTKMQAANDMYLQSLLAGGAAVSGGGGGGGGGRRYGGGGSGGSGTGEEDGIVDIYRDPKTTQTAMERINARAVNNTTADNPGFYHDLEGIAGVIGGLNAYPDAINYANGLFFEGNQDPTGISETAYNEILGIDSELTDDNVVALQNAARLAAFPAEVQMGLDRFLSQGNMVPSESGVGYEHNPEASVTVPLSDEQSDWQEAFRPIFDRFYTPANYTNGGVGLEQLAEDVLRGRTQLGQQQLGIQAPNSVNWLPPRTDNVQPTLPQGEIQPWNGMDSSNANVPFWGNSPDNIADGEYGDYAFPGYLQQVANQGDTRGMNIVDRTMANFMINPSTSLNSPDLLFDEIHGNNPVMERFMQYMEAGPSGQAAYWESVYPTLNPNDRALIDRAGEIYAGYDVPNSAQAAAEAQHKNQLRLSLARAARQNINGPAIEDPATSSALIERQVSSPGGTITPEYTEAAKAFDGRLANLSGLDNPYAEGEFYNPNQLSEAARELLMDQRRISEAIYNAAMLRNENVNPSLTSSNINDTVTQQLTDQTQVNTYDPDAYLASSGQPISEMTNPEEWELIEGNSPNPLEPQGFAGNYNPPDLSVGKRPIQMEWNPPDPVNIPLPRSNQKSATTPLKKAAQAKLDKTFKNVSSVIAPTGKKFKRKINL